MQSFRTMRHGMNRLVAVGLVFAFAAAEAHHSVLSEFGDHGRLTSFMEGEVVSISWRNPHVNLDIRITSGDGVEPGTKWRVTTHPTHILDEVYGFRRDQFAVGDVIRMHGWKQIHGQLVFQPRALQINDGPMRSLRNSADGCDIAAGQLIEKGIGPSRSLDGSSPGRAGQEAVDALREMGYLDQDNLIRLPDDFRKAAGMN